MFVSGECAPAGSSPHGSSGSGSGSLGGPKTPPLGGSGDDAQGEYTHSGGNGGNVPGGDGPGAGPGGPGGGPGGPGGGPGGPGGGPEDGGDDPGPSGGGGNPGLVNLVSEPYTCAAAVEYFKPCLDTRTDGEIRYHLDPKTFKSVPIRDINASV